MPRNPLRTPSRAASSVPCLAVSSATSTASPASPPRKSGRLWVPLTTFLPSMDRSTSLYHGACADSPMNACADTLNSKPATQKAQTHLRRRLMAFPSFERPAITRGRGGAPFVFDSGLCYEQLDHRPTTTRMTGARPMIGGRLRSSLSTPRIALISGAPENERHSGRTSRPRPRTR
jgi:hypothetical protein